MINVRIFSAWDFEQIEMAYKLRYAVFANKLRWVEGDTHNHIECDHWDSQAVHFGVFLGHHLLAYFRILKGRIPNMMLGHEFIPLLNGQEMVEEEGLEITRLAVSLQLPKLFRHVALLLLYRRLFKWAVERNLLRWWMVSNKKLIVSLRKHGYEIVTVSSGIIGDDPQTYYVSYVDIKETQKRFGILQRLFYVW